jgi:peptidoglycan/LPS O-acetylase OafA/YrhL
VSTVESTETFLAVPPSLAPPFPTSFVRPPARRFHLPYLDGLRGCAALFVVLHHVYFNSVGACPEVIPRPLRALTSIFLRGQYGVDVFIVLSGYCLMLPLSQSGNGLHGGAWQFVLRRARRILPAYYAALALCLLTYVAIPALRQPAGTRHDSALPALDVPSLLAHAGLVHNLSGDWALKIDPPMWSVATEWQIYFVFALVLVPLWRRVGVFPALLVAVLLGQAPRLLVRLLVLMLPLGAQASAPTGRFDSACFWFIGLFALGMVAAEINLSPARWAGFCRRRLPWDLLAALFGAGGLSALALRSEFASYPVLADYFVGLAAAVVIVYCTRCVRNESAPTILAVFQSQPAVALGQFSYSLYLTHWPVLALLQIVALGLGAGPLACLWLLGLVGIPLSLALAYVFYRAFERPFLRLK